jgi:hypothetical protein
MVCLSDNCLVFQHEPHRVPAGLARLEVGQMMWTLSALKNFLGFIKSKVESDLQLHVLVTRTKGDGNMLEAFNWTAALPISHLCCDI